MARTSIAQQAVSSTGYPTAGTNLTLTAADASNQNSTPFTGREIIFAINTHASTGYTATITSATDSHSRTGTIAAEAIAAGEIHMFGPFKADGWMQTGGVLYFDANNDSVKFFVVQY
jgi:hypothetical protein